MKIVLLLSTFIIASVMGGPVTVNLVDKLKESDLNTVLDMLKKASLLDAINGTGPLTVIAPTNQAFVTTNPVMLKKMNDDLAGMKAFVSLHILPGQILTDTLKNDMTLPTLNGAKLRFNIYSSNNKKIITVNGVAIVDGDISAANGVIHKIDRLLSPIDMDNIPEVLEDDEDKFSTLLSLLNATDLMDTLEEDGPFTLFAPTNDAFRLVPEATMKRLAGNPEELKKILLNHVIPGTIYSPGLFTGQLPLLNGGFANVTVSKDGIKIDGADIISPDISAVNGVVHVINKVIGA